LWRTPRNGIDPEKLDIETVKAVHRKHFPSRDYNNFAPLYCNKARAFCTARDKDGHRLSKFQPKQYMVLFVICSKLFKFVHFYYFYRK
jgi:hypothetical protein